MCVFCTVSYCDQHVDGNIKTCSFSVRPDCQIRHHVCMAHQNMPSKVTKLKASEKELQDGGTTEPENPALEGTADIIDTIDENLVTCGVDESSTEVSTLMQKAGSDDDAKVMAEVEKMNSVPLSRNHVADALDTTRLKQLRVRRVSGQQQKFIAAKMHKKNGIISDVVETGTASGCESVIEPDSCEIRNEKPIKTEKSTELNVTAEKSPIKRCKAPVVNGFHSSVSMSTRRRSTLQECSQAMNLPTSKLDTVVGTVTALLDELSDSKDLKLVNVKELVIDGN